MHTRNYRGRLSKSVAVTTNDPAQPAFSLVLSFTVNQAIEVLPSPFFNLLAVQGAVAEGAVVLRRPDGKPLQLKEVTTPQASLEVAFEAVTAQNADPQPAATPSNPNPPPNPYLARAGDWRIKVKAKDTSRVLNENGNIKVLTDHPEKPEIIIPVAVGIRPVLDAYPQIVQIQVQSGGAPGIARVDVRHNGRQAFKVTGARLEGDLPGASARIMNDTPSSVQPVEVKVASMDLKEGVYRGKLFLSTDQAGAAEKVVEIMVRVTAPPAKAAAPPAAPPSAEAK